MHNVRFDRAEQQAEQRLAQEHDDRGDADRDQRDDEIKLLGRVACAFALLGAEQLRHHDRAACCQGGKDIDNQHVEHIDQGNAGNSGLPNRGYHNGVGQADGDGQDLLQYQRPDEFFQRFC